MDRRNTLNSIPEQNEVDEEPCKHYKWVPKSKHEVLKAKYKCLKKLFQLYDANVIGLLPNPDTNGIDTIEPRKRRRRSHRTKTDAGAGTTELSNGDLTQTIHKKESTTVTITTTKRSATTTEVDTNPSELEATSKDCTEYSEYGSKTETSVDTLVSEPKADKYAETANLVQTEECNFQHIIEKLPRPYSMNPYYVMNRRPKPTRFQCFIQRILGIRRCYTSAGENMYCASDGLAVKRRRKGIRFRRLRRAKKNKSDSNLLKPSLLTYVQSVQRNCLMDTTPRQCPILGCQMISYGIINYNDHLNLCHFKNRKHICHFCHEGFENELEKNAHENQHIGINAYASDPGFYSAFNTSKTTNITQTEPEDTIPNDKLKKIVSFFERFNTSVESEKKNGFYSNLPSTESESVDSELKVVNCMSVKKFRTSSMSSETSTNLDFGLSCQFCGERFRYRRQLSMHEQMQHKRKKFTKYNSCPGIHRGTKPNYSEDGQIVFESRSNSCIRDDPSDEFMTKTVSDQSSESVVKTVSDQMISEFDLKTDLTCDPSTNIVYLKSMESVNKSSVVESLVNKVRGYKWEGCK